MSQETQIGNLSGGISDEDSKLVDSILNDLNSHSEGQQQQQPQPQQQPQQGEMGQMPRQELTPEQMRQIQMQRQMAMQQQQDLQNNQLAIDAMKTPMADPSKNPIVADQLQQSS